MDFLTALNVSASGLSAQRTRVNIASSNLANAETTRGVDGRPYQRMDPVFEAVALEPAMAQRATLGSPNGTADAVGVHVSGISKDQTPGKKVYAPGHPDADPDGFVQMPNVNPVHEVVNLMSAQRGYEANAVAIETLKTMAQRALDIAR